MFINVSPKSLLGLPEKKIGKGIDVKCCDIRWNIYHKEK